MRRLSRAAALLAAAALCGGCASAAGQPTAEATGQATGAGHSGGQAVVGAAALPLITSAATGQASWAVLPMGAASGPNEFWQLFGLKAGSSRWSLATPPDIATNGAIDLTGLSGDALVAGVHPSLYLDYSPVSGTRDAGRTWTPDPPAPGLASVPDALAATPDGGHLLALDRSGQVQAGRVQGGKVQASRVQGSSGAGWATLASTRSLASTAAGRACGLTQLTAVAFSPAAFSPAAVPLVAGDCARAGTAGIFGYQGGSWRAAGPPLPGPVAGQPVDVLRLASAGGREVAVLRAGAGASGHLFVAWADGDGHWTCSASIALAHGGVAAASFGSGGSVAVVLANGTGETLAGPAARWRPVPALPPGRAVALAQPPSGGLDALAADGGELTVWQLRPDYTGWTKAQAIRVPIQYGSSS